MTTNVAPSGRGRGGNNVISPAKESNYAMIDDILGELAALFPFDYVHIGGDEVNYNSWKDCPEIQDLMRREKLAALRDAQVYFTKRLEDILARHHKLMIGWNKILNDKFRRSTAILSWTGTAPGYQAARQGFPVVMAPGPHCYFDMGYAQGYDEPPSLSWAGQIDLERCYAFDPLAEKGLTAEQSQKFLGVQACLWSELVTPWKAKNGWLDLKTAGETADYKTFPRLCALAEMGWTPQASRNIADLRERLGPHLLRLKQAGIVFRVPMPDAVADAGTIHILPPFDGAEVRYTIDGSDPLDSPTRARWEGKPVPGKATAFRAGPSSQDCRGRCASALGLKPPAARCRNRDPE